MIKKGNSVWCSIIAIMAATMLLGLRPALAADTLEADAQTALDKLTTAVPAAKALAPKAKAILVFPALQKAAVLVGATTGDGVEFRDGKPAGQFTLNAVSVGMQAGAQTYSYAMFFMTDESIKKLQAANGWEVGTASGLVVVDAALGQTLTTTTIESDVYAFNFGEQGLMLSGGLQGSRITKK